MAMPNFSPFFPATPSGHVRVPGVRPGEAKHALPEEAETIAERLNAIMAFYEVPICCYFV